MARLLLALTASRDIESILSWTEETLGERIRIRYESLIFQALDDIADDPQRSGVIHRPEIFENVMTYHLFFSRNHVPLKAGRIREPRHFLMYRLHKDGLVEINRVLHDSMEFIRHLPSDLRE